ncbi:NrtR DNA-binding winged helix domain-containing protein [Telmatospirillum sp.]|uniref:NUDIX hydrolase n=1 Tax=Telmatospirillum sp. TaxID=2079197 RepID=UPI00283DAB1F|nr:NUDIX domain-containing protein [Telmatospirillum sp.]MDR3437373.1 NUDIX domain-containing protein [Telmatospirillum sp.]
MAGASMLPLTTEISPPNVTVDLSIFALVEQALHVLLMKRTTDPFADRWALPGGYIHTNEDPDVDAAARRVLKDKTAVETPYLEQVQSFGDRARDPRGWTVSIAYMALISAADAGLQCGSNAAEVCWWPIEDDCVAPPLAFDHSVILATSIRRLRNKVEYSSLPVHLLPERFTLPDLQAIYERILGRRMDKSAFRKRIAEADFVEAVPGEKRAASNRPAQIYRLKPGSATIFFDRTL